MRPPAVESAFDVALWFVDRALNENEYIQPQKLHRLLYLAQAYFAVANHGRMLMPGLFVADKAGPVEPNIYRAFQHGRPYMEPGVITETVSHFLDSIWRRFGHHSADYLTRQLSAHDPYVDALKQGERTVILLEAMTAYYGMERSRSRRLAETEGAPTVESVLRPRVMRSQDGRPVNVNQWMPPAYKKKKKE